MEIYFLFGVSDGYLSFSGYLVIVPCSDYSRLTPSTQSFPLFPCNQPHCHRNYPHLPNNKNSNSSPDYQEGSVVDAKWGSLSHVIDTVFTNNRGTALQNRGTMMVISSRFIGNAATPFFDSSDNIEQGSGVGGAIMNSAGATMVMNDCCLVDNTAETDGPAIWTAGVDGGAGVAEVGGTCAASNVVTGPDAGAGRDCNGVFDQAQNSCSPFNACGKGVCSVSTM